MPGLSRGREWTCLVGLRALSGRAEARCLFGPRAEPKRTNLGEEGGVAACMHDGACVRAGVPVSPMHMDMYLAYA